MKEKICKVISVIVAILMIVAGILVAYRVRVYIHSKYFERDVKTVVKESKPSDLIKNMRKSFKNDDIIAYLCVPDAGIYYPVVQGETNDDYLRTDIHGRYSIAGSLFLDCYNSSTFVDRASVIYGHHMYDGTYFGNLEKEYEQDIEGKQFQIYTRTKMMTYSVIASTVINGNGENIYLGYPSDTIDDFANRLKSHSYVWDDSLSYNDGSRFCSLMTCSKFTKSDRFGVTGLLVDEKSFDVETETKADREKEYEKVKHREQ